VSETTAVPARDPLLPVHFFIEPAGITLDRALTMDPDADWTDLRRGPEIWIAQTWHRLKRAGFRATMSDEAPREGIIVYHKEHQRSLLRKIQPRTTPVLVGVRADFRSCDAADFELLQNGYYANDRRAFFVPSWPQPGLLVRDASRGERIDRISYKGYVGNLVSEFRGPRWKQFVDEQGMIFDDDAVVDNGFDHPILTRFHDYRDVDLVLAVRPGKTLHKQASKLFNAWLAGVPALLSPDYAFEELRQSPLDYLAVRNVAEAEAAVLRLKREPGLYRAMIEHGLKRAQEYTVDSVATRWAKLLYEIIPSLAVKRRTSTYGRSARGVRTIQRKFFVRTGIEDMWRHARRYFPTQK
jgi:hypothetical protein